MLKKEIKMRLKITLFFLSILIFTSCSNSPKKEVRGNRVAKGIVHYGGVFRLNETDDFRSLYPLNVTEDIAYRISAQVYEGLVKISPKTLAIVPSIAEKWEITNDSKTFIFHLRKGVKFQNDSCFDNGLGREVTAKDFKYCFEKLCTDDADNQGFAVFDGRVKGASEYYTSTEKKSPLPQGVSGIKVIDNYTLQIDLEYPFSGFLNILAMPFTWVFPKEAVDKYGIEMRTHCVGTGPFFAKEIKYSESVILARNESYWAHDSLSNQLPYLDVIKFSFNQEKRAEYLEFRKGKLEYIFSPPAEMRADIVNEFEGKNKEHKAPFVLTVMPSMSVEYYGFQMQSDLFKNKYLRQAFNYAIDRGHIAKFILQNDAEPAVYGIVPPSFPEYNNKAIKGFTYNPVLARELLAKAGYPNGKGFPADLSLQLNSGGDRNVQVAQVVQKMLADNLNIYIKLNVLPFAQQLENQDLGKALFFRGGWVADYPDPQSFLDIFYGKLVPAIGEPSPINSCRYQSAKFDSIYSAALMELDIKKRFALYEQADQIAIDDAAFMPVYYDQSTNLTQNYVKNLVLNAMQYLDFSEVYFDKGDSQKTASKNSSTSTSLKAKK